MINAKRKIVNLFPIQQVRLDFENWFKSEGLKYNIPFIIYERDNNKPLEITISKNEKMTALNINMHIDLFVNIEYYISIALGSFIPYDECGIAGIEKGVIQINYNEDMSLRSADLFYYETYHLMFLRKMIS
ncbi:MAG: hypothetical protein R3E32_09245 [Chitinophagales bacterium]